MIDADRRLQEFGPRGWTLFAAVAFGLGGIVTGGPIVVVTNLSPVLLFDVVGGPVGTVIVVGTVGVGSFVSGAVVWRVIVERPRAASLSRGAAVGVVTVVLANALSVFSTQALMFVPRLLRVPGLGTSVEATAMPLLVLAASSIWFTLSITGLSLVLFGVLLFPVGITIGLALSRLRRPTIGGSTTGRTVDDTAE